MEKNLCLTLLNNVENNEIQGNFGRHPSSFSTYKKHFNPIGPLVHWDPQVATKQALLLLLKYQSLEKADTVSLGRWELLNPNATIKTGIPALR